MRPDVHELAVTLAGAHARIGVDLLSAVAAAHRQGVPAAVRAGVTGETFIGHDDLRTIWLALHTAADHDLDREGAARLCCRALKHARHWWIDGPIALGPFWNVESVVHLFFAYPSASAVPALAVELVELARRWRRVQRAAELFEKAVQHAAAILHPRHNLEPGAAADRSAA